MNLLAHAGLSDCCLAPNPIPLNHIICVFPHMQATISTDETGTGAAPLSDAGTEAERGGKVSQADFQLGAGGLLYDSSLSLTSVLNATAGILKHGLEERLAL